MRKILTLGAALAFALSGAVSATAAGGDDLSIFRPTVWGTDLGGIATVSYGGIDRTGTSMEIAYQAYPGAKKVYVASGYRMADALTAASLDDAPLVLLMSKPVQKEYLQRVVAIGCLTLESSML